MANYSEMSDDKINLQVFECLFGRLGKDRDMLRVWQQGKFQPCNSWKDAGPIILSSKLWLRELYGKWDVKGFPGKPHKYNQVGWIDENPLRAAMIVYLMMQEAT